MEALGRGDASALAEMLVKSPSAMLAPIEARHLAVEDHERLAKKFHQKYACMSHWVQTSANQWAHRYPNWASWALENGQIDPVDKILTRRHPDHDSLFHGRLLATAMQLAKPRHLAALAELLLSKGADANGHHGALCDHSSQVMPCQGKRPIWVLMGRALEATRQTVDDTASLRSDLEHITSCMHRLVDAGADLLADEMTEAPGSMGLSYHQTVLGKICRAETPVQNREEVAYLVRRLGAMGANLNVWRHSREGVQTLPASAYAISFRQVGAAVELVRLGGASSWDEGGRRVDVLEAAHQAKWRPVDIAELSEAIMRRAIADVARSPEVAHPCGEFPNAGAVHRASPTPRQRALRL